MRSLVGVIVAMVIAAGAYWGTDAVGGSDSHCYVGQARMWRAGWTSLPAPFPDAPWPNASATFAPSGFTPGPQPLTSVPLCAAGLPWLMAVAMFVGGGHGWFWVVPVCGGLAAWAAYRLGTRLVDPVCGVAAAILAVSSPTFLYQLFQPMSDVPAAALWLAALAVASAERRSTRGAIVAGLGAGLYAGLAVLVRPNLVPLAVFPGVLLVLQAWPVSLGRVAGVAAMYTLGVIPGIAGVALAQVAVYGHPLRSGYGDLGLLFAWQHVPANLVHYPRWLWETHGPVLLAAPLAFLIPRRRLMVAVLVMFAATVLAGYLPYTPFDNWSYTRFVLPGVLVCAVMVSAGLRAMVDRFGRVVRVAPIVATVVVVLCSAWWLHTGREIGVFQVKAHERKYQSLGAYVAAKLPSTVVVLAAQPTGAIQFYAGRPTLSWDAIDPAWFERVLAYLRANGHDVYFAVETFEADTFRAQFRQVSPLGQLDWPPRAVFGRAIALYRADDRAAYLRGERIPSERFTWDGR